MQQSGRVLTEEGDWTDIIDFSAAVSDALAASDVPADGFETWRPKDGEEMDEVKQRTVDGESIGETRFEAASDGTRADIEQAGDRARDSGAALVHGNPRRSAQKAGEVGEVTATGLFAMLARLVRSLENGIYRHVVEPTNPDYFESEHLSASLYRCGIISRRYRCRIVFDDSAAADAVADRLTG
ncbi:MAG: DUF5828 family protein [Candidatus Nanohaloarchaea archaeon]|nr:DUF5828 family protein [Candidatus Nanohaloarchaea archaeon]